MYLVRHTEPEVSFKGRCYGSLDVGLSDQGVSQAGELARSLSIVRFDAVYSSPRRRCLQVAEALAGALKVEVADGFRELDFGEFEGRAYDQIAISHPDVYRQWMERPTSVQFPGGESFAVMQARVLAMYHAIRIQHSGHTVAIVAHGGVIRIVLAEVLGIAPEHLFRIGQRYGAINRIRYFGDAPVVELVNADTGMDFSKR